MLKDCSQPEHEKVKGELLMVDIGVTPAGFLDMILVTSICG